ncbi:sulfatase-like hydrolase/transferase [candidate division KSB1 bacterium]|nr:sulfatase-like hydrolase/transferase [candidate division KSB1 bacterium]
MNVLFIMCDQMNGRFCSFNGDPLAEMPNLERLSKQAVVFRRAYCNNPLCTPSRCSMLTGS